MDSFESCFAGVVCQVAKKKKKKDEVRRRERAILAREEETPSCGLTVRLLLQCLVCLPRADAQASPIGDAREQLLDVFRIRPGRPWPCDPDAMRCGWT